VHRAGFRIVWADDAITRERVHPARARASWLLRRSLRIGGTDAFVEKDLEGLATAVLRLTTRSARYGARGAVRLVSVPLRGRGALLAAGPDWARVAGLLAGLFGYRHREY
jgi:hypothetical protein